MSKPGLITGTIYGPVVQPGMMTEQSEAPSTTGCAPSPKQNNGNKLHLGAGNWIASGVSPRVAPLSAACELPPPMIQTIKTLSLEHNERAAELQNLKGLTLTQCLTFQVFKD